MRESILFFLAVLAACSGVSDPSGPPIPFEPTASEWAEIAHQRALDPAEAALVGSYYRGDGLGLNLVLSLLPDGSFRCQWTGCMGDYGSCSGVWSLDDERVNVRVDAANGLFKEIPLGNLDVESGDDGTVLIPVKDRAFYDSHGPSGVSCFTRQS